MLLSTAIFIAFTLLASGGAYLILAHFRSRRAGLVAALATFLFFVALFAGLIALMRGGGAL
jgi:hypothetical protein